MKRMETLAKSVLREVVLLYDSPRVSRERRFFFDCLKLKIKLTFIIYQTRELCRFMALTTWPFGAGQSKLRIERTVDNRKYD